METRIVSFGEKEDEEVVREHPEESKEDIIMQEAEEGEELAVNTAMTKTTNLKAKKKKTMAKTQSRPPKKQVQPKPKKEQSKEILLLTKVAAEVSPRRASLRSSSPHNVL